jgi:hypothetical protein
VTVHSPPRPRVPLQSDSPPGSNITHSSRKRRLSAPSAPSIASTDSGGHTGKPQYRKCDAIVRTSGTGVQVAPRSRVHTTNVWKASPLAPLSVRWTE